MTRLVILNKFNADLEKRKKFNEDIKQKYSLLFMIIKLSHTELDWCANEL